MLRGPGDIIVKYLTVTYTPLSGPGVTIKPSGTNAPYIAFCNLATSGLGNAYVGLDSAGGSIIPGSTAKSFVIGMTSNIGMQFGVNNAIVATMTLRKFSMSGSLNTSIAGYGLTIAEGDDAKQGVADLVLGVAIVSNKSVTANSRIFLTAQDNNTVGALRVSARTAGVSFTISSSFLLDTGTVAYEIFEPGT